jgi:hypothetical protein
MKSFELYINEGWKMNKTVSKENEKLIDLKTWSPELEYVNGKDVIIKVGTSRSEKYFFAFKDGKAIQNARGKDRSFSKLTWAKDSFK